MHLHHLLAVFFQNLPDSTKCDLDVADKVVFLVPGFQDDLHAFSCLLNATALHPGTLMLPKQLQSSASTQHCMSIKVAVNFAHRMLVPASCGALSPLQLSDQVCALWLCHLPRQFSRALKSPLCLLPPSVAVPAAAAVQYLGEALESPFLPTALSLLLMSAEAALSMSIFHIDCVIQGGVNIPSRAVLQRVQKN